MTTRDIGSVLKDVVAYVDVWSSEKTANYSKPFIQQLQEMGAQVSKTFNKHVTHVVFSNGHPATWRKAKKSNVRLVSVLWIGRCFDDRMHVDEDLYPALNDETNPVLKNKKHRCMQPKDSPEKTPETDRRMKRKLDKMMKDLPSKQPLVTDVSPIIIDQESGIVYSPALKRSDYMARRLKDMKKKRENLSPTASQMVECCSPTELKPSLGSTPTVFKLMFDQSDDDSSASAAEPGCSPDKEERRTQLDVGERGHHGKRHKKSSEKPWMSPCHVLPKTISSPVKCPDFEETQDVEVNSQRKSRRSIVRKKPAEKCEISCQDARTDVSKNFGKEKRRSQIKSSSLSPNKSEKGKRKKMKAAESFTPASIHPGDVKSSSCRSSAATSSVAAAELLKETATSLEKRQQRTPKKTRRSLYASVRSLTLSGESRVASSSTAGDDDVFEDYFSPANHNIRQISERPLLANLQIEEDIHIPFELDPVPKKRKQRGESTESETNSKKKKKLEESQSGKLCSRQSNASSHQLEDVKELQPSLDSSSANVTLVKKRRRQSTLPFTSTGTTESDAVKRRRESASVQSKSKEVSEVQKNLENEGNERAHAAGLTEIPSEVEENHNKQVILGLTGPVSKTKAMRTLVMTSMPTEKQNTVVQVVKVLGGFSIADRVCESTTHVVSGSHRRTLNILFGIARGCWILSFEWILWCLEQRQWIPEEPYELSDQFPAAQICRLQRHLSAGEHQQDLFQDQPAMFVSQHSQPPTQSLVELIQLCGGTACKTVRQAGICIGRYSGRRPEGSRILSEQWVLDCITHLKLLPYENYDLE